MGQRPPSWAHIRSLSPPAQKHIRGSNCTFSLKYPKLDILIIWCMLCAQSGVGVRDAVIQSCVKFEQVASAQSRDRSRPRDTPG